MEIHFQQQIQQPEAAMTKTTKFKGRSKSKSKSNNSSKYVGVRQRPSGRWVAEIKDTTQKIRMWLGTFETAEEAARAYDEAACLLRGSNTRTNFVTHVSPDSPLASRIRNLLNNKRKANKSCAVAEDSRTTAMAAAAATPQSPSSCVSSCSNSSVDCVSPLYEKSQHSSNLFDDAYKPDLSNCCDEFHQSVISWGIEQPVTFDYRASFPQDHHPHHQLLEQTKNVASPETVGGGEMEFFEFERMKVERQISASLYAMNGVHEYMETVGDPIEALWDLPPLCSLLC